MDEKEVRKTIERASASLPLIRLRERVGTKMGAALVRAGQILHAHGHIIGTGRIDGSSVRGNGDDEVVAVGALLQIGGELALPAIQLFAAQQHYAAAALVRQLVEVEYLMWAFESNPSEAKAWLNSTREERREFFQPARLRKKSNGRFKDHDYWYHCELGGHPVPRSMTLLAGGDARVAQLLVVDILLHGWRTMDSAVNWSKAKGMFEIVGPELGPARAALAEKWGTRDPLYKLPEAPRHSDF
jgi:hypothetical protein